jgi:hypothetical protein
MGPAKKDDFRGITAKNADQKQFFSNFVGLTPRGNRPQFAKKIGLLWLRKSLFFNNLTIFAKNSNDADLTQTL